MIEVQGNVALFLDTMSWYSKLKLDTERAITDMYTTVPCNLSTYLKSVYKTLVFY